MDASQDATPFVSYTESFYLGQFRFYFLNRNIGCKEWQLYARRRARIALGWIRGERFRVAV